MSRYEYKPWTTRIVRFEMYPRQGHLIEPFMDALVEHYWERPDFLRRFIMPGIASTGPVVEVNGLPWWMPAWWARRTVARIAYTLRIAGAATYVIERATLFDDDPTTDPDHPQE